MTMTTVKLTPSEIKILTYYRSLREERFYCSITTIAKACTVTRTVQWANAQIR